MGNKIGRRRQVVDEKYTRPQGLYQHRDIDHKKLRKLILDSKLAPCYPGDDDCSFDLEECPICFLYYPSLNRSRCCMKGICTECFLQMKPPHSTRPTQCPFCKMSNYAVEYRGVRTKEEKGIEQVEEQKVIEAQIRMKQQELQDAEERVQKRQDLRSFSRIMNVGEVEYQDVANSGVPSFRYSTQSNDIVSSQGTFTESASRRLSHSQQNREDNFDMDLEDIMVMEAIWLSIQEGSGPRNPVCSGSGSNPTEASPSDGLACTVAALAERQHMNEDLSIASSSNAQTVREERSVQTYPSERWVEVLPNSGRAIQGSKGNNGSVVAEVGPSYASSDIVVDAHEACVSNINGGHLIPDSYEEQVMLATAVSLAEARDVCWSFFLMLYITRM